MPQFGARLQEFDATIWGATSSRTPNNKNKKYEF